MKVRGKVIGSTKIAAFISRLMHPCLLGVGLLLLAPVVYGDVGATVISAVVVLPCTLVAVMYVRARTSTRGISLRVLEVMTEYLRYHPKDVIVLVIISGLPATLVLTLVGAPQLSIVTANTLTATALALALVNLRYRASYHVAAVTSLALVSATLWAATFPVALAAVPLVAWARHRLGQHTAIQISVGCVIATLVSIATFTVLNYVGVLTA